jgi:hypothetical protein
LHKQYNISRNLIPENSLIVKIIFKKVLSRGAFVTKVFALRKRRDRSPSPS